MVFTVARLRRRLSFILAIVAALGGVAARGEAPSAAKAPIRVVIFNDLGGGDEGPKNLERCLAGPEFTVKRVKGADIRDGVLNDADVLIHPGGSGSKQATALQDLGRERVRKFVDGGGGYVGICAGAYLATTDYTWSLGILDAKVIDRAHWARGNGPVDLKLSARDVSSSTRRRTSCRSIITRVRSWRPASAMTSPISSRWRSIGRKSPSGERRAA